MTKKIYDNEKIRIAQPRRPGQRDLTVIPYIAGEGATVPRKSLINANAIAATRVSQGSHTLYKTQGNILYIEKLGNLREFTKQLREFLKIAKSQAILREWLWQI